MKYLCQINKIKCNLGSDVKLSRNIFCGDNNHIDNSLVVYNSVFDYSLHIPRNSNIVGNYVGCFFPYVNNDDVIEGAHPTNLEMASPLLNYMEISKEVKKNIMMQKEVFEEYKTVDIIGEKNNSFEFLNNLEMIISYMNKYRGNYNEKKDVK